MLAAYAATHPAMRPTDRVAELRDPGVRVVAGVPDQREPPARPQHPGDLGRARARGRTSGTPARHVTTSAEPSGSGHRLGAPDHGLRFGDGRTQLRRASPGAARPPSRGARARRASASASRSRRRGRRRRSGVVAGEPANSVVRIAGPRALVRAGDARERRCSLQPRRRDPRPSSRAYPRQVRRTALLLALVALAVAGCGGGSPGGELGYDADAPLDVHEGARATRDGVVVQDISYTSGDDRVEAYLVSPPRTGAQLPAVVFLHGAGGDRDGAARHRRRAREARRDRPDDHRCRPAKKSPPSGLTSEELVRWQGDTIAADIVAVRRGFDVLDARRARRRRTGSASSGGAWAADSPRSSPASTTARARRCSCPWARTRCRRTWTPRRRSFVTSSRRCSSRSTRSRASTTRAAPCSSRRDRLDSIVPRRALQAVIDAAPEGTKVEWYPADHALDGRARSDRLDWLSEQLGIGGSVERDLGGDAVHAREPRHHVEDALARAPRDVRLELGAVVDQVPPRLGRRGRPPRPRDTTRRGGPPPPRRRSARSRALGDRPATYASSSANAPFTPAQNTATSSPCERAASVTAARLSSDATSTRSQRSAAVTIARVPFVVDIASVGVRGSRYSRGEFPRSNPSMRTPRRSPPSVTPRASEGARVLHLGRAPHALVARVERLADRRGGTDHVDHDARRGRRRLVGSERDVNAHAGTLAAR